MTDPLEEAAEELTRTVAALNDSIQQGLGLRDELARLVDEQARMVKRSRATRRVVWLVTAGFALDVVLTVAMALVGHQAIENSNRIDRVVRVQHDSALCPLYRIFIEGDTPANRARAEQQGQDMTARARAYVTIRASYAALNCKDK